MSYTKRFLVTNRKNEIQVPLKAGFETTEVKSAKSPSLLSLDAAKAFAAHMAAANPGKSYYVSEVLAGVKTGGGACWGDAVAPDADSDNE